MQHNAPQNEPSKWLRYSAVLLNTGVVPDVKLTIVLSDEVSPNIFQTFGQFL